MTPKKLWPTYICGRCNEEHEYEADAEECCAPRVKIVYLCPVCSEHHSTEADALACCPLISDSLPSSLAELEAQQRLPL